MTRGRCGLARPQIPLVGQPQVVVGRQGVVRRFRDGVGRRCRPLNGRRIEAEHLDRQLVVVVHHGRCGGVEMRRGLGPRYGGLGHGVDGRGREELVGNAVVFGNAAAPDFRPDVVAAARGDDREVLAGELGHRRELVLHGAELVQGVLQLRRQQLSDDPVDRFEREAAAREVHLSGGRHDVRLVAGVHDERFAIDPDNRLKQ